jgi:MFS family permease
LILIWWRFFRTQPEFLKLWTGQAISSFGSAITALAMPLAAVVMLHASPVQMGALTALTVLPHLLFGLPAGVWVDRLPLRPILIVADVGRAIVLGCVPVLGALGLLRMEHLYAVAFLAGILTMLFETAGLTLMPALVGREHLMRPNGAMQLNISVAATAGPSVAGALVQLLTAPIAIAVDAVSFVLSAVCAVMIRVPSDVGAAVGRGRGPIRLRAEMVEGLRALFASPLLSAMTVSAMVGAFAGTMQAPLVVLYLVRELHLSPPLVGLAVTVSGVGAVAGALLAPTVGERLGPGPAYITGQLLAAVAGLALAAAHGPLVLVAPFLIAGQLAGGMGVPLYGIMQRTIRQTLVPERVLGRVNATWRFLVFGAQPVGALLGGTLGATLDLRQTLVLGSLGILLAATWATLSPLRTLRHLPA